MFLIVLSTFTGGSGNKCEHCIGSGEMSVWNISVSKGVNFNQGYVICKKAYNTYTLKMRVMKFFHKLKR